MTALTENFMEWVTSLFLRRGLGDAGASESIIVILVVNHVVNVRHVIVDKSERRNEIQHENNAAQKPVQKA